MPPKKQQTREFDLHTFLVGKLRAATKHVPHFAEARKAARVAVIVGSEEQSEGGENRWVIATVQENKLGHKIGETVKIPVYRKGCYKQQKRLMNSCAHCHRLFFDYEYVPCSSSSNKKNSIVIKKKNMIAADHIIPCIDPEQGFQNWDTYITRMFCGELQILCNYSGLRDGVKSCHAIKTAQERKEKSEKRLCKK